MAHLSFIINENTSKKLRDLNNKVISLIPIINGLDEAQVEAINKYAMIGNIGASTRIENALLTDQEVEWIDTVLSNDYTLKTFEHNKSLIENKLSKNRERSIEEVTG